MTIIIDEKPIPVKVDLTDLPSGVCPARVRKVRTYAVDAIETDKPPRYVFVSEHYEI